MPDRENGFTRVELRFRFILLTLVGLVAVAVWTFPAWRAYLRQRGEIDAFPGLELELQDDFLALAPAEREALLSMHDDNPEMAMEMVQVAIRGKDTAPQDERSGLEAARAIASGEFQKIDALHWGEGTATIYELADARRILRFENFTSAPGGDVRVYLSRDPLPLSALELGNDFLDLGRLKGNIGDQRYFLPADHDLSVYNSAVVYCRQFSLVITVARLQ